MEKFNYEANGYNRNEVNHFVNEVIEEMTGIVKKCREQQLEIEKLKNELKHYKNMENENKDASFNAEIEAMNIKSMAKKEAEIIVADSKNNASRIVNEALLKAERIENRVELLENNMKIFKRKFKIILEEQQAVLEEVDKLELSSD